MIKKVIIILIISLSFSCITTNDPSTKPVDFTIKRWTTKTGSYAADIRIIGTFNDWGSGGLDAYDTWDGATHMIYDKETEEFKVTIDLEVGKTYNYCYKVKYSDSSFPFWVDPKELTENKIELKPYQTFRDNGLSMNFFNAEFTVTE